MARATLAFELVIMLLGSGCTTHLESLLGLEEDGSVPDQNEEPDAVDLSDLVDVDAPDIATDLATDIMDLDGSDDDQTDAPEGPDDGQDLDDPTQDTEDILIDPSDVFEPDGTADLEDPDEAPDTSSDPPLDAVDASDIPSDPSLDAADASDIPSDPPTDADLVELDQAGDPPPDHDTGEPDADEEDGCSPQPGLCDGEDDDCDGQTDEGRVLETFELTLPTADWADVDILVLEAIRVDDEVFAYLQVEGEFLPHGLLIRFATDGSELVTQSASGITAQSCFDNPQIAIDGGLVAMACDSLDSTLVVYLFDARDLSYLDEFEIVLPESWTGFTEVDLEVYMASSSNEAPGTFELDAKVFVTFQSDYFKGGTDVFLVMQQVLLSHILPDPLPVVVTISDASAPSLSLLGTGPSGEDRPQVLHGYYMNDTEVALPDRFRVDRRTETLVWIAQADIAITGFLCPGDYHSEADAFTLSPSPSVDGYQAMMVLDLVTRPDGAGVCAPNEPNNTSILYGWATSSATIDDELVELEALPARRSHVILRNEERTGSWMRLLPTGSSRWGFSHVSADGELSRQSEDMPRTTLGDLLTTEEYFGAISLSAEGWAFRWDLLGCD